MSEKWLAELKDDLGSLRRNIGLRGLADYILMNYTEDEQDKILQFLNDPTKTTRITIEVIDKQEPKND